MSDSALTARGAPGRVAAVQIETRRGLMVAVGFAGSAVVTGVAGVGDGWWLPLHLFVVGGLLSAISAVTQMFAVTWSASPAPRPIVAGSQRWLLAAGVVALVIGHENSWKGLFVAGGVGIVLAVIALAAILIQIGRAAVTDRYLPAIEANTAAIVLGAAGMSLGIILGAGWVNDRATDVRHAHLVLNLFGMVGLVIAGTLPYFVATQVRSKMSPRARPEAMRATFAFLALSVIAAAIGAYRNDAAVFAVGLIAYAIGLCLIVAMLPIYGRGQLKWAGPRAIQLLAGMGWWIAITVVFAAAGFGGSNENQILRALVVGGFAQILVASLAYLAPVLRGGGHERLSAGFAATRSWVSVVVGNVAGFAALAGFGSVLAVLLVIWFGDVAVRGRRMFSTTQVVANV